MEPSGGQEEPDEAGELMCALEVALPEQRPSCPSVTERFLDHPQPRPSSPSIVPCEYRQQVHPQVPKKE